MQQVLQWLTGIFLLDALTLWWFSDEPFIRVATNARGLQISGSVAIFFLGMSLICLVWSLILHWWPKTHQPPQP